MERVGLLFDVRVFTRLASLLCAVCLLVSCSDDDDGGAQTAAEDGGAGSASGSGGSSGSSGGSGGAGSSAGGSRASGSGGVGLAGTGGSAGMAGAPNGEPGVVTGTTMATRVSGVAPLAVLFTAMNVECDGCERPFHDLDYEWDFGDPESGEHRNSGLPRNMARGPIAAHLFERPGTYQVRMIATDPANGDVTEDSHTIEVADPDEVFGDASTVCVRATTSSDFAGCPNSACEGSSPPGDQCVTQSEVSEVLAEHLVSGKRILLRRGDSFTATSGTDLVGEGPGLLGAFGDEGEPKPAIALSGVNFLELADRDAIAQDWRVMDLAFTGNGAGNIARRHAWGTGQFRQLTFLRLEAQGLDTALEVDRQRYAHTDRNYQRVPEELAVIDNDFSGTAARSLTLSGINIAVMGNRFADSGSHLVRMQLVQQGVIQHNQLSGPVGNDTLHLLKIHANANDPDSYPDYSPEEDDTRNFIVSDNRFYQTEEAGGWMVAFAPTSDRWDEDVYNFIVERNYFRQGAGTSSSLFIGGVDATVRNNICDMTGGINQICVRIEQRGDQNAVPVRVRAYHNTCYSSDSTGIRCVSAADQAEVACIGNLRYAPDASSGETASGCSDEARDNADAQGNPFASDAFGGPDDFLPSSAGTAAGGCVVRRDFFDAPRPDDACSLGALEPTP